jgi:pimeloyl-ACP methyl ester carboxylesterase
MLLGLGYGAACAAMYAMQERLVYFPDRTIAATPRHLGLDYQDVWLQATASDKVHGWWVPAPGATRAMLFLHGNAGNISHRLETLEILHELGLDVLIIDYRGYGRSEGRPGEAATYEDAAAAWEHLVMVRRVPPERIVVFGRSLGGGVASWLATRHRPAGLILESSFTSVPDVAAKLYPVLPVRLLARIRYPNAERIATVGCPVLVAHSADDELIPYAHGRALFEAAAQPKSFLEMRGSHGDGFVVSGRGYVEGLRGFLDDLGG